MIRDINGDITISRAAARELEYAVTPSYETTAEIWGEGWPHIEGREGSEVRQFGFIVMVLDV